MTIKLSRQNYTSSSTQSRPVRTFPNTQELENIISKIVELEERQEIESKTFLSLHDLIVPSLKPKRSGPPRAQNCFLIFRKDLQANLKSQMDLRMTSNGLIFTKYLKKYLQNYVASPEDKTSGMKIVSNTAFKMWAHEIEIKQVYIKVSKIAKAVHKFMWPDYKYQPNRKKRIQNSFHCDPYIPVPLYDYNSQSSRKNHIQNSFHCDPYIPVPRYDYNSQQQLSSFSYPNDFVSFHRVQHIAPLDINLSKLNYFNDKILRQSVEQYVKI
ncbi:MATA-HMG [Gigaspora margarita]|uniref:MATA-HMG n=1 Tax=Gigaspora margarita TaxID=4874 RepID=A0A8H3ZZ10_GIGMA|nr:MATA-HMG [Gigaspora margarita]